MKVLHLTLSQDPFNTMVVGYKDREYRKASKWIKSRLIDSKTGKRKKYDVVKFTNGYGRDKPYFIAPFLGFEIAKKNYKVIYPNGFSVNVRKGEYRIKLGAVIRSGNINSKELF